MKTGLESHKGPGEGVGPQLWGRHFVPAWDLPWPPLPEAHPTPQPSPPACAAKPPQSKSGEGAGLGSGLTWAVRSGSVLESLQGGSQETVTLPAGRRRTSRGHSQGHAMATSKAMLSPTGSLPWSHLTPPHLKAHCDPSEQPVTLSQRLWSPLEPRRAGASAHLLLFRTAISREAGDGVQGPGPSYHSSRGTT